MNVSNETEIDVGGLKFGVAFRDPAGNVLGSTSTALPVYNPPDGQLGHAGPASIAPAGGNQPHNNVQPSLGLTFIIALQGIFPSQN